MGHRGISFTLMKNTKKAKNSLEKRGHHRVAIKIPVKFRLEQNKKVLKKIEDWRLTERNAFTLDVSLGGMQIAVDKPLKVDDVLQFHIYLLDKVTAVNVYAKVVRITTQTAGLQFLMMKDEEKEAIKAFLAKVAST